MSRNRFEDRLNGIPEFCQCPTHTETLEAALAGQELDAERCETHFGPKRAREQKLAAERERREALDRNYAVVLTMREEDEARRASDAGETSDAFHNLVRRKLGPPRPNGREQMPLGAGAAQIASLLGMGNGDLPHDAA